MHAASLLCLLGISAIFSGQSWNMLQKVPLRSTCLLVRVTNCIETWEMGLYQLLDSLLGSVVLS